MHMPALSSQTEAMTIWPPKCSQPKCVLVRREHQEGGKNPITMMQSDKTFALEEEANDKKMTLVESASG